ncbi:acid phosphatase [Sphingomonas metalli]|uniref:Acid phosphatase n=2 Tax=Sphingomonas metalli TaxID=1779358 RepID=A0A916X064_9SPHN|nr:acid phosphatase [Sphingomonas metalli]
MKKLGQVISIVALACGSVAALAQLPVPGRASAAISGYLAPDAFDILRVLPPAPTKDDPRYKADRETFRKTRSFYGTPRWDLAVNDVKLKPEDMMRDFSCAAGVTLTPGNAPKTLAVVMRAARDTQRSSNTAKQFYKHPRPYQLDRGRICQPATELADSPDYPSGHTTYGWTWATLLAELMPDRATAIAARGRAYGESRIICGVHNRSAVDAGLMTASATLAAVQSSPVFQSDLAAARAEIDRLRRDPSIPPPAQCDAEEKLTAQPLFTPKAPRTRGG